MKKVISTIPFWAWVMTVVVFFVNTVYIVTAFDIPIAGMGVRADGNVNVVTRVLADSPAGRAGIRVNDTLLLMNGATVEPGNYFIMLNKGFRAGQTVHFTFSRQGKEVRLPVQLTSYFEHYALLFSLLYCILTLILLLNLYLLYKKPDDKAVRVFSMYIFLFVVSFNSRYLLFDNPLIILATSLFIFGFTLYGPCLMYFHMVFPSSIGLKKLHLFIIACFVTGAVLGSLLTVSLIREIYQHPVSNFSLFLTWSVRWMAFSLITALIIAIIRYRLSTNKLVKKQLKLIIAGSAIALVTPIVFGFFTGFMQKLEQEQHMQILVITSITIGSTLMVALFYLAIFMYRIWDIEIVIKKALLYVFATGFILGLYALSLYMVNVISRQLNEDIHFLFLALAILVFMLFRDRIQQQLDKLFYKKKNDPASVIAAFEHQIAGKYIETEIVQTASDFISSVFPVKSVNVYLKDNQNQYFLSSDKTDGDKPVTVEVRSPIREKIQQGELIMVEDISTVPEFFTGASVIVPITDKQQQYGFLMLGPRLDEVSWKINDMHILSVFAGRIASLLLTADFYRKHLKHQLYLEHERTRVNAELSIRETEILSLLARGFMYKEIADQLFISTETVRTHLRNIYEKLQVRTRTEAVLKYLEKE